MPFLLLLAVLFPLVLVHEYGHYITAKWSKMRVDEFAIGFPPRLFSWLRGETRFALNLIPIGGYVKIYGENGEDADTPDTPRAFSHRPRSLQALVLVAGVTMNILFAWFLSSIVYMTGVPTMINETERTHASRLMVTSIIEGSPAELVGVHTGDRIVALGAEHYTAELTPSGIATFIKERGATPLALTVERSGEHMTLALTPRSLEIEGEETRPRAGFTTGLIDIRTYAIHHAIIEAGKDTARGFVRITKGIVTLIRDALVGDADLSDVAGPVGIAGLAGDASRFGFSSLLIFTAFISLNLAVINLVPLPALDGGRLVIVIVEAIIRRPLKQDVISRVNAIGFIFLLLLMAAITLSDIVKILR